MEDQLARKTYIAIHTYMSDEAKKQMLTTPYEEDKQMLNGKNDGLLINVNA
jgi:hypothetical protein